MAMYGRVTLSLGPRCHKGSSANKLDMHKEILRTSSDIMLTLVIRFKKEVIKMIDKRITTFIGAKRPKARVATYHDVVVPHYKMNEGTSYVKCLTHRDKILVRYTSLHHTVQRY